MSDLVRGGSSGRIIVARLKDKEEIISAVCLYNISF